jgi:HSP20 family protein
MRRIVGGALRPVALDRRAGRGRIKPSLGFLRGHKGVSIQGSHPTFHAIYETDDALIVVMEVPGVEKKDLSVNRENDLLRVEAQIDYSKYHDFDPLYSEYNVGHFARAFTLSNKIDQQAITAQLEDGVLTLTLRKAAEAKPRRIAIN